VKSNKTGAAVRKAAKKDPRVDRSTTALGAALVALMQERPFDSIKVQDVLDRAGVARSTFYAHFSNTNDLFLSDYERMLTHLDAVSDTLGPSRLLPVAEMLEHFAEMRPLLAALRESGRMETVREIAAAQFARTIARRAAALGYGAEQLPASRLAAVFCAGAVTELSWWWLDGGTDRPPALEIDARFHAMAWGALRYFIN
jgi:AcrR family transcriptional regulator